MPEAVDVATFRAAHADTLQAVRDVVVHLPAAAWGLPTGCPGWTVQDQVAHICDVEHMVAGDPQPQVDVALGPHVVNPIGERMEPGVELRRGWSPHEVIADLEQITARRLGQLEQVQSEKLGETVHGHPLGPMPLRTFLTLRVFDIFAHEQDIRRAVGRRSDATGAAARLVVPFAVKQLGRLLYDREPDLHGQRFAVDVDDISVVVDLTGDRASVEEAGVAPVRLSFDVGNFLAWVGGRSDTTNFERTATDGADAEPVAEAVKRHAGMTP